jgi:hypothetical protein
MDFFVFIRLSCFTAATLVTLFGIAFFLFAIVDPGGERRELISTGTPCVFGGAGLIFLFTGYLRIGMALVTIALWIVVVFFTAAFLTWWKEKKKRGKG